MYLIDADVFIEEWIKYGNSDFIFDFPLAIVREVIANTPTVDAEPVKHGKWVETKNGFHCSNCKRKPGQHPTKRGAFLSNFCPN